MAGTYKTAGRQRLLSFFSAHPDRQFTADEIAATLQETASSASKSSLYRHLSELCADGVLRKYRDEGQSAYVYQYVAAGNCSRHFHLKCMDCGRIIHLECDMTDALLSHILSDHRFRVDSGRSILYGVCTSCGEGKDDSPKT